MSGFLERDRAAVSPPGSGGATSITTASSTAINLSAFAGHLMHFSSNVSAGVHLKFGTSTVATATTSDFFLPSAAVVCWRLPVDGSRSFLRARAASGSGSIFYRRASGPL